MNAKLLNDSDASLHDVEMSVRRKQMGPFMTALLSEESKAIDAKLAMFQGLVTMLEKFAFDQPVSQQDYAAAREMCIEASKLVLL